MSKDLDVPRETESLHADAQDAPTATLSTVVCPNADALLIVHGDSAVMLYRGYAPVMFEVGKAPRALSPADGGASSFAPPTDLNANDRNPDK